MPTAAQQSLKSRVISDLRSRISDGALKPGDVVATQDQLVSELRISRSIVREAVESMQTLGIVRSVQRKGVVVAEPDPLRAFEAAAGWSQGVSTSIVDLFEARYCLEVGAIDLVVPRINDSEVAELERIARQYAREVEKVNSSSASIERIASTDLLFHTTLLGPTGSWLKRMHGALAEYFERCAQRVVDGEFDLDGYRAIVMGSASEHLKIVEALAARNLEASRAALIAHLRTSEFAPVPIAGD